MFTKLILVLVMCSTLNEIKILANPIEIPKPNFYVLPFQLVNNTNLLAYQEFDLKKDHITGEERKKRFLEDLFYMFNLWENAYEDDDEDDSSSGEDSSEENVPKNEFDLCRNCSVTLNKIKQVQHIHHSASPSNQATSNTTSSYQTPSSNTVNNMSTTKSITTTAGQNFQPSINEQKVSLDNSTATNPDAASIPTGAEKSVEPVMEKSAEHAIEMPTINLDSAVTEASAVIEDSVVTRAPVGIEDSAVTEAPAVTENSAVTAAAAANSKK